MAKELGIWDVNKMLRTMSAPLFMEWMQYAKREPFGEQRADMRSAQICSIIANVNRGKKSDKIFAIDDFLLCFDAEEQKKKSKHKKTWQQMKAEGILWAAMFGEAKDVRKHR